MRWNRRSLALAGLSCAAVLAVLLGFLAGPTTGRRPDSPRSSAPAATRAPTELGSGEAAGPPATVPPPVVEGAVVGPGGIPVASADLEIRDVTGRTAGDGTYHLSGLEPGEVVVICYSYPGLIPHNEGLPLRAADKGRVRRVQAGEAAVDFVLNSRTVDLQILNEEGEPVPDAQVSLGGKMETSRILHRVTGTPDEHGRVLTVVPRQDLLEVYVLAEGYDPLTETLRPEEESSSIRRRLVLSRSRGGSTLVVGAHLESGEALRTLHLRLVAATGATVPGWKDRTIALDRSGAGRYEGIPPGEYTAHFAPESPGDAGESFGMRISRPVTIPAAAPAAVDLVIPLGGRVRVTLRNREGEIVAPGTPNLYPKGSRWKLPVRFGARTRTGYSGGSYTAQPVTTRRPVLPGEYELSIRDGKGSWQRVPIRVLAGEVTEVDVRLLGGN